MKKSESKRTLVVNADVRDVINEIRNRTTERHIALKGEILTIKSVEERECEICGNVYPVKMFRFRAADQETIVTLSATKCIFIDEKPSRNLIVSNVVNKVYILKNAD